MGKTKACLNLLISLSTIYTGERFFSQQVLMLCMQRMLSDVFAEMRRAEAKKRTSWRGMANARHLFPL